jgi:hypothetical protein
VCAQTVEPCPSVTCVWSSHAYLLPTSAQQLTKYVYIYICMPMYTQKHVFVCVFECMCVCMCVYACVCVHMCACVCCAHVESVTFVCVCVTNVCVTHSRACVCVATQLCVR